MTQRINPTLFDKLVADRAAEDAAAAPDEGARFHVVPRIERFNETALRATLLRELAWLLNTTGLAAVQDLSAAPEVMTSTLNYGLGDLSGTLLTRPGVQARARDMREAIARYEPRIARGSLEVEPAAAAPRPNSVGFVIRGDVSAAVQTLPVEIRTEVDVDTGAARVGEG
ncbi:type VI secretion system baseplate subunit TssE [Sphingomonas sp. BK235]|uniref:type VI secretion system baseplate subunit TssE n=1 Tax=Sphingomonas sp. BK235 TaxID=2512131 RepID=UPI001052AD95|nr:type VI secretion system baseplate subunit TssE [Sphingomonas sp. BK235]TCP33696.1 type VI secretion system protein ImpF [Sphingomonas sp. BK235]